MKKTLTYRGFTGSVEPEEDGTLFGKVQGIGALVMYDGEDMADLEKRFHESVDAFLEHYEAGGWDPYSTALTKTPLQPRRKSAAAG